jgi:CRP-like cAMP-binding protein
VGAELNVKRFAKGETIYAAGAPASGLLKVCSGAVMLYQMLEDGRRQIIELVAPGEYLHFETEGALDHFAEALTDAELVCFGTEALSADPALAELALEQMRARLQRGRAHVTMLGRKSAAERLADFLDLASERLSSRRGEINLPMTRQQIADYTGLTLETVSRFFSKWARERRLTRVGSCAYRVEAALAA